MKNVTVTFEKSRKAVVQPGGCINSIPLGLVFGIAKRISGNN